MNSKEQNSANLQSLNDLITALCEEERTNYDNIIRSANLPNGDFTDYSSWSDECYARNCIIENEEFELILLCWEAGQKTAIHDHGGEECWVKIIQGEFKETRYEKDETGALISTSSLISKANNVTYMIDFMGYHCLENISKKRSMSLHLYAKPIRNCNVFDEKSSQFISKNLSYDTFPCD
ncbi:Cysteine dioxygenase [Kordia antarctica]|uniref:Cysteine dioxygenase n=1 Tax=Kordia antarctica TaxID=1218801 RepID=A0A7L4ZPJ3_9FLAO|nr:cysteine dioxygenase family protein [Kordia antarctica]QHI38431.1 Cysteine dioxygenase [Kordia antarctica]